MNYAEKFGEKLVTTTAAEGSVMTEDQAKDLVMITLIKDSVAPSILEESMSGSMLYQIMSKRLSVMAPHVEVDIKARLWMYSLASANPGKGVMLCTVLAYLYKKDVTRYQGLIARLGLRDVHRVRKKS